MNFISKLLKITDIKFECPWKTDIELKKNIKGFYI